MSTSSKIGGVVFGLYFALCALVAVLVAVRDRAPAGLGRVLLISAAVVHGLLGAFAWGLVGWTAFLFMVVVLGLIVLLLMTYDRAAGPQSEAPGGGVPGQGRRPGRADRAGPGPRRARARRPAVRTSRRTGTTSRRTPSPAQITVPAPTTP